MLVILLMTTMAAKTMIMPKSEPSSHYPLQASISRCSSASEDFLLLPESSQLHGHLAFSHRRNPQIKKKHLDQTNANWKATDNRRTAMNHHPRLKDLRSIAQLLREAASSFSANIVTFLFLSLLILSFRTVVENGTTHVTSFIYRDPSLKAFLSRLDLAGNTNSNRFRPPKDPSSAAFRRHRRSPFLHLTRVGTLDGDFFSSDDDDGRSLFGPNEKSSVNGSFVFFGSFNKKSELSDLVIC